MRCYQISAAEGRLEAWLKSLHEVLSWETLELKPSRARWRLVGRVLAMSSVGAVVHVHLLLVPALQDT